MSGKARFAHRAFYIELIFLLMFSTRANAQLDSIQHLQPVEVSAQRISLTDIGKHTESIDSATMSLRHHESLASLLSTHTPLYVRSYGAGTLATLGIRGGGAAHTQILWNGIPLRNPMLGLVDLALIPSAFVDEASIHYGGHGAAFGSGAVGGLISVSNDKLDGGNAIHFGMNVGSWGLLSGNMRIDYGTGIIKLSSRFFSQTANNNYNFRIAKGLPEKKQVHNHISNRGFLQEVFIPFSKKQSITARFWYQDANRQIPPLSTQSTSQAAQQDENLRMSFQWNYQGDKVQWQIKSALLDETIDYQDTLILLYTHNRFRTWLAEGSSSFTLWNKLNFAGGVYAERSEGESENYTEGLTRSHGAIFSSIRFTTGNFIWRVQAREEITEDILSPLLFDISGEWLFAKSLTLKSSFSKNYRMPTLNDQHWRPGGNPDLIPEDGYAYEAGLNYNWRKKSMTFNSAITGYRRMINNWIMWMPPMKDVSFFWTPINVAKIKSKGIETRSNFSFEGEKIALHAKLGLDLTWSNFATSIEEFRIKENDRLFYIPVTNFLTSFRFNYLRVTFNYDHHWFGDSPGINDHINAFSIGNAGIGYNFSYGRWKGTFYFQSENVWNSPHRIIERRPMPGRSGIAGFKFSFS